ncbi:MAG: ATP-binding protein [Acidimicrobiia bacterium]|nr:ATP-binding protein [Acidimicrobiia bacterium]
MVSAVRRSSRAWPFVGRARDLTRLDQLTSGPGERIGAVLIGEPGAGKTRLLDEFVAATRAAGTRVRVVRATGSGNHVPLAAVTDVLGARLRSQPEVAPPEVLFHEAVAALVSEAKAGGRWLLAVDDLPQLDDASAAALHQCLIATGAPMVATARSSELRPAAFDALWRDGSIELMPVEPLSDGALSRLLDAAVELPLDARSRQRLVALAGGNPLTLRELVAGVLETGALARDGEFWSLTDGFHSSHRVSELVERRLALAEPADRRVLELVALAEPVSLDALFGLVEPDVVDRLVERGLLGIDASPEPRVWSGHPLFAEVLRAELPPGRQKRLAAELAPALATDQPSGPAFLRWAVLAMQAGVPCDPSTLARAAAAARHGGAHELALQFAQAALAHPVEVTHATHATDPTDPAHATEASESGGDGSRALASLTRAAIEVATGVRPPRVAFAEALAEARDDAQILAVVGEWSWATMLGESPDAATAVLAEGRRMTSTRVADLMAQALSATMAGYAGRWATARAQTVALERVLEPSDPVELRVGVCSTAAMASSFAGPSVDAVAYARRAARLATHGSKASPNQVVFGRGGMLYGLGETEGFEAAATMCRSFIEESLTGAAYLDFTGMWYGVLANQATTMGVLTEQTRYEADEAVRFLRWRDPGGLLSFAIAARGTFAALCGDLDTAEAFLDEYDDSFRSTELKTTVHADRGRAWLSYQRGDHDGALAWAERGWQAAWDDNDVALWAAPAAHDLVRFGRADLGVDRLDAAAARLCSPFAGALAAHGRAVLAADADAIVEAASCLARLGAGALAAEALVHASTLGREPDRAARRAEAVRLLEASLMRTPAVVDLDLDPDLDSRPVPPSGRASAPPSQTPPDAPTPDEGAAAAPPPPALVRKGQAWLVSFGSEQAAVRHLAGLEYVAALLANPGEAMRASSLAGGGELPRSSRQAVLDDEARRALEERGTAVVAQLVRARRRGDAGAVERLEAEAEALAQELERTKALGGNSRDFADADERARTAVRKAIVRALSELEDVAPLAAGYLRPRIITGTTCQFSLDAVS